MIKQIVAAAICAVSINVTAQTDAARLIRNVELDLESTTSIGGNSNYSPFWFSHNRHGLSSLNANWNYERIAARRSIANDSKRRWKLGWGADVALMFGGNNRRFFFNELFFEAAYRRLYITAGSKYRQMEMRNNAISSGTMGFGINATPIPQVRAGMNWFDVPFTKGWWQLKGHLSFGWYTDGSWTRDRVNPETERYSQKVKYHEKAVYTKVGRLDKFPLQFEMGLEFNTQYGGKLYNVNQGQPLIEMTDGFKGAWNALFFRGADVTDGDDPNFEGNHFLAWRAALNFERNGWKARVYADLCYEDNLSFRYGFNDYMLGCELNLPKNRFVNAFVFEYFTMYKQTGSVFYPPTPRYPDHIGGRKNIYNHHLYNGWTNYGMTLGNPLVSSPVYNDEISKKLEGIGITDYHTSFTSNTILNNRVRYWHVGLQGEPIDGLTWRLLMTFSKNWGTYSAPFDTPAVKQRYYLLEVGYQPGWKGWNGWQGKLAFGLDRGILIGNNTGAQLTIIKHFDLNKR